MNYLKSHFGLGATVRISRDDFGRLVCAELQRFDVLYHTSIDYRAQLLDNLFDYHWRRRTGAGHWFFGAVAVDDASCPCMKSACIKVEAGKFDEFKQIIRYQLERESRSYGRVVAHLDRKLQLLQSKILYLKYLNIFKQNTIDIVDGAYSTCETVQKWVFGTEKPSPAHRGFLARRRGVPTYEEVRLLGEAFFKDTQKTRAPVFMHDTNYGSSLLGRLIAKNYYKTLFMRPMPPPGQTHWYNLALYALATIVTCQSFGDGNKRMGRLVYALILGEGRVPFIPVDPNNINRLGNLLS